MRFLKPCFLLPALRGGALLIRVCGAFLSRALQLPHTVDCLLLSVRHRGSAAATSVSQKRCVVRRKYHKNEATMSKKPRPKKHYRPHAITVPSFLGSLNARNRRPEEEAEEDDRLFCLRIANRTAPKADIAAYCQFLQIAWLLAARMENAKALRELLNDGLQALEDYLVLDAETVPSSLVANLTEAVETGRQIYNNAGDLERSQAIKAVMTRRVKVGLDGAPITDEEVRLN